MGPIVAKGGDLEAPNVSGVTPLMLTCATGMKESALALVGMGADPLTKADNVSVCALI